MNCLWIADFRDLIMIEFCNFNMGKCMSNPVDSNLSERVLQLIKNGIANHEFESQLLLSEQFLLDYVKEKLSNGDEKGLARTLSKMPIRRAIALLEAAGVLDVLPQRGTKIRTPSDDELREVWENRVAIEDFILTKLARSREINLSKVCELHLKMKSMLSGSLFTSPTDEEHRTFVSLDEWFHAELARAAGFPGLADELAMLRMKLQLAAPVRKFSNKQRYFAIANEHEEILKALGAFDESLKPRPDINAVRLAFFIHMKNSSRDSWRIEQRINRSHDYGQNNVFDVPDISPLPDIDVLPVEHFLQMRLSTEYCAVALLASQPGVSLHVLDSLHNEMKSEAATSEFTVQTQSKFINLDITFHSALCFAAGILFGEEVVGYSWHKVWKMGGHEVDRSRANTIVAEHENILSSIRVSRGTGRDIRNAVKSMEQHVFGAFVRNNFDKRMIRRAMQHMISEHRLLKRVLDSSNPE